ncbi:onanonoxo-7-onima-8-eninoihtemlysoneda [Phanerochaete sordida]|uniref:Onanonoxo-7-onima-8-eninoihtemlysoneda n=1 Tax=Phanerochaete sordida TaxID=48140 RepID=A0A9P3G0R2_9APHY|nr:onanonoxo-7-onima-8-eninoihtemlysoneda [Phanerochaete sordida]
MSVLFHHLRVHQVFGANTDVGKTLLTTALVRASSLTGKAVYYLKPVSTGPLQDADDEYITRFAGPKASSIQSRCLFRYSDPVSPHLAAQREHGADEAQLSIPSDGTLVKAIRSHIHECARATRERAHMYVETAGGVHSPTLSGSTQIDAYRPLFLPTILVGDHKLGGISATISSYESLLLRGYIVDAVMIFREEYYRNWEYLRSYFAERDINVAVVDPPPPKHADPALNLASTDEYYQNIVPEAQNGSVFDLLNHLDDRHANRIEELNTMPKRTLDTVWWPFVQHGLFKEEKDVNVIDSASGDEFSVFNGRRTQASVDSTKSLLEPQFDGSASWWTQALGHANPALTMAAARAAGRYGHVMFPQGSHLPALKLAERLVKSGPGKGWASRAYISDNGSSGMEIALKMALRAYAVREREHWTNEELAQGRPKNLGVLGLKGSYHGDTIGAMDACEDSGVYTCEWHDAKGYWFDPPTVGVRDGRMVVSLPPAIAALTESGEAEVNEGPIQVVYSVEERLDSDLAEVYRAFIQDMLVKITSQGDLKLAALVLEPIVMGAGGMIFVDPLFQRILVDSVRSSPCFSKTVRREGSWSGLPVIFDEVFAGLYRLGMERTSDVLGVTPDVAVNAKILTGGLVPLAVTLATQSVFDAFYGADKADALLHGHSYTAYPVGCEVANESLRIIDGMAKGGAWDEAKAAWRVAEGESPKVWSFWDPDFVGELSKSEAVGEVMAMGTVLALKIAGDSQGYQSHSAQKLLEGLRVAAEDDESSFGINYRTLGNVAYFMLSLNTPTETVRHIEDRIWRTLQPAEA